VELLLLDLVPALVLLVEELYVGQFIFLEVESPLGLEHGRNGLFFLPARDDNFRFLIVPAFRPALIMGLDGDGRLDDRSGVAGHHHGLAAPLVGIDDFHTGWRCEPWLLFLARLRR